MTAERYDHREQAEAARAAHFDDVYASARNLTDGEVIVLIAELTAYMQHRGYVQVIEDGMLDWHQRSESMRLWPGR